MYLSDYTKPIYLKVKVENKWFVLSSYRVVNKPEFGGVVIIGCEAFKRNSVVICSSTCKCKLAKYSKGYDKFIVF